MPDILVPSILSVALLAIFFQFQIAPIVETLGFFRVVETENRPEHCLTLPEVTGCEKVVVHQGTGLLYMACATIDQRSRWMNPSKDFTIPVEGANYLALYDPENKYSVKHITLPHFDTSRTIAFHGMDVVPSKFNENEAFIYLIHHRVPIDQDVGVVGYDSCVEIFKTVVGSTIATHLHTIEGPVVQTPNDLVGASDGKSFYFTNDGKATLKAGTLLADIGQMIRPTSSVGYCHVDEGCKIAIGNLLNPNGITQAPNGTIYVGCALAGGVKVMERQADNTLSIVDVIPTDTLNDNLTIDEDGFVWAAGIPKAAEAGNTMRNMSNPCPHVSWKLGVNTGPDSFNGQKYNVENVLQDDGQLLSFITTVAYDSRRERLFLHGLGSHWLTVCDLPKSA
ncbi:hypothetical protein CPB85DRAFT_1433223 [Mucidula mucida]|nr:hypothetical protein CPB85DRAFT_1433223 [Mucidula mucida]